MTTTRERARTTTLAPTRCARRSALNVVVAAARALSSSPTSAPPPPPPPYEYRDSLSDIAFIALCRLSYGKLAGFQSDRSWKEGDETYRGMVEVSRALMRKLPQASRQSAAVVAGFPRVAPWFRALFPYSSWGAELNARITPAFFGWLVGPAAVKEEPIVDFRGDAVRSAVRIERCRYLAESGCVGMCVNLCRTPVQKFFGEELGVSEVFFYIFFSPGVEKKPSRVFFFFFFIQKLPTHALPHSLSPPFAPSCPPFFPIINLAGAAADHAQL